MCGIVGVFNHAQAVEQVLSGLEKIGHRGRDGYGLCFRLSSAQGLVHGSAHSGNGFGNGKGRVGDSVVFERNLADLRRSLERSLKKETSASLPSRLHALGHALHALVGFVPQPLRGAGVLAANCEIYNWKALALKYHIDAANDSELLLKLIEKKGIENLKDTLAELDGVYAFVYWQGSSVYLVRDIMGVKPLWYVSDGDTDMFAVSSEQKVLCALSRETHLEIIRELNPREILIYDLCSREMSREHRPFFSPEPEARLPQKALEDSVLKLLTQAVKKRIPETSCMPVGLLFSGGVDSTTLGLLLQRLGADFICYTAVIDDPKFSPAPDLLYAERASREYGFKLVVVRISLNEVEGYLKKVVPLIEDSNVVKVGVALPFYLASERAQKDGCRVLFSGLGSEEVFAGYERHRRSANVNLECRSGLLKMYERDLYRDDVITMAHSIELRLPYLDRDLVCFGLGIPPRFKLGDERDKIILRRVAERLGLSKEFAWRRKQAAQYGSKCDRAIEKLAHGKKMTKSGYLKTFFSVPNLRLGVLFSSGKDSTYALSVMKEQNYEISCLISLKSENKDSYMFHTPAIDLVHLQAEAMGIPLLVRRTAG
ncbi:ATP-binding protein, partial [Candidatus Woesearchaeota archaeon CG_4_10_14_0_8_um_filter_47_5]